MGIKGYGYRDEEEVLKAVSDPESRVEFIRLIFTDILGEHIFGKFIANKEVEIAEYKKNVGREYDKQVSEYEISRYLPVL